MCSETEFLTEYVFSEKHQIVILKETLQIAKNRRMIGRETPPQNMAQISRGKWIPIRDLSSGFDYF